MDKFLLKTTCFLLAAILLAGCAAPAVPQEPTVPPTAPPTAAPAEPDPTVPPTTEPTVPPTTEATEPDPTTPAHSPLYLPGLDSDDAVRYFSEVSLDAEMVNSGDARLLQKWVDPICYGIWGDPTPEDLAVLEQFTAWINTVEGFPGISESELPETANLRIYFCSEQELLDRMGDHFAGLDGAVTFWYYENEIFDAVICIRTDLDQQTRNSVILEELYNGLGPIQDTALREDSIIYSGYSIPQALTEIDKLILKLLYHPSMKCGWDAEACADQIRKLYY